MPAFPGKNRRALLRGVLLAVGLFAAIWWYLDGNLTRVVLSLADARARALAVQTLNEAAEEAVSAGVSYDRLMAVTTGSDGTVRLIQANTAEMNRLASHAALLAQTRLEGLEEQTVSVPLGSALGLTLFAGRGPRIPVSIVPVGSVSTSFKTEFEACGINQTRHKVYLELTASIRIVIPTGAKTTEVAANMLVAESIIVGAVPEGFVGYDLTADELNMVP